MVCCVFVLAGPTKPGDVDPKLLCPIFDMFCCYLPQRARRWLRCGTDAYTYVCSHLCVFISACNILCLPYTLNLNLGNATRIFETNPNWWYVFRIIRLNLVERM